MLTSLVLGFLAYDSWFNYQRTLESAEQRLTSYRVTLVEHARTTFSSAQWVLDRAHAYLDPCDLTDFSEQELHGAMQDLIQYFPQIGDFTAQLPAELTRSALQQFIATVRDGSEILQRNLQRAAELIASFKQVAVDQSSYQRREFALEEVAHEIALALSPTLRRAPATLEAAIDPGLRLDSFPGPLGQVLMSLITNALVHAFHGRERGVIRIASIPVEFNLELPLIAPPADDLSGEVRVGVGSPRAFVTNG